MDDTAYDDTSTPTVTFTYTPGFFRVDSNQTGFGAKDIDAICSIGSSTKKGDKDHMQSIGEKGIGFKSNFRVARKIWLSSREYSIMWDRAAKFGALVPQWADFPRTVERDKTSFLLELGGQEEEMQILQDLETLDSALLLFLNRLRVINIELHDHAGHVRSRSIRRETDVQLESLSNMRVIQDGDHFTQYLETRYCVQDLPKDSKRAGCASTEMILAFPLQIDCDATHQAIPAYVYSGLPVERHGLKVSVTNFCRGAGAAT